MTNIFKKSVCAAAAVAVSLTGLSAVSAQSKVVRTAIVSYADLDLNTSEGQSTLEGRIRGAVRQVCGGFDPRNIRDVADHSGCMKEALASANRAKVSVLAAAAQGETSGEISIGS